MALVRIDRGDVAMMPGEPLEYLGTGLSDAAGKDNHEREDVNRPRHERPDHL